MTGDNLVPSLASLGKTGDFGALAHYADPAYYSHSYRSRRHDVEYYVRRARERRGAVLEYGCGNGRVTLPMAAVSESVVGIDLSGPMLEDLERRLAASPPALRQKVSLIRGDMRTVKLEQVFSLIVAPFNTFLHLYERTDVEQFLARVKEHLAPGGRFVFDVSVPQPADLGRDPERRYPCPRFRHPETKQWLRYTERFEYDPLRQLLLVWMEFVPEDGSEPWVVPLTHRQFFPAELLALLHHAGFESPILTADFGDDPPDARVDSLVLDCGLHAP